MESKEVISELIYVLGEEFVISGIIICSLIGIVSGIIIALGRYKK